MSDYGEDYGDYGDEDYGDYWDNCEDEERLQQEQEKEDSKNTLQEDVSNDGLLHQWEEMGKKRNKGKNKRQPKRRSESEDSTQMNAQEQYASNLNQHVAEGGNPITSGLVVLTNGTFQKLLNLKKNPNLKIL